MVICQDLKSQSCSDVSGDLLMLSVSTRTSWDVSLLCSFEDSLRPTEDSLTSTKDSLAPTEDGLTSTEASLADLLILTNSVRPHNGIGALGQLSRAWLCQVPRRRCGMPEVQQTQTIEFVAQLSFQYYRVTKYHEYEG